MFTFKLLITKYFTISTQMLRDDREEQNYKTTAKPFIVE